MSSARPSGFVRIMSSLPYLLRSFLFGLLLVSTVQGTSLDEIGTWFPHADHIGMAEGDPPARPVFGGGQLLGHVFETDDVLRIPAYSGKPVNLRVGIDLEGRIVGAEVLHHEEPIMLVGIPEQALSEFSMQFAGLSLSDRVRIGARQRPGYVHVDGLTGATVTVMVIGETIMQAARRVFVTRGTATVVAEETAAPSARVREDLFAPADWAELLDMGAVQRLHLTRGEVDDAFVGTAAEGIETAPEDRRDDDFIDLYYAYLDQPTVGRNLLGDSQYDWLMGELADTEHAIAIMADGLYSFKGSGYVRGGIFDRIQLQQDHQGISFRDLDHHRLVRLAAEGAPRLRELGVFVIREQYDFDPARPWELELLVRRQIGPLDSEFLSFTGEYRLPERFLELPAMLEPEVAAPTTADLEALMADEAAEALWVRVWRDRVFHIVVLGIGLAVLTFILIFQDLLTRRPRLLERVRIGFLIYTVVFIGWYALAQLSVVNVLTFTRALFTDFNWETFLVDPMMFILWSFVAVTLLLWGRGVYCGWLCPFGAIQELVNKVARRFKVRQFELPFAVHERLWALKYLILLGLFAISLQSLAQAEIAAEVEPFKTAITMQFQREWGFVLYAGGLILISAFNHKFYCRYLCPLGAALAIPARIRLFDWLKRRNECGKPCQVCAHECEIQAIHPDGRINPNECHYCLDCQVTYFNDHKCPPLVAKRKRREKIAAGRRATTNSSGLDAVGVRVEPKPTQ